MQTFSDKVKEDICEAQNGYCVGCFRKIESIHHKLPNTKANRKKFPLFIHSIFNAVGLSNDCHSKYPHIYRIDDKLAQLYEEALSEEKK